MFIPVSATELFEESSTFSALLFSQIQPKDLFLRPKLQTAKLRRDGKSDRLFCESSRPAR